MRKQPRVKEKIKIQLKKPDKLIILITFFIALFGLIMIFDASLYAANSNFKGDTFKLVTQQAFWFVLGSIVFALVTFFPHKHYRKYTLFLFLVTIFLLILTLLTANAALQNGAKRWIVIAGITIQPSEIAKLTFILYLASWLSKQTIYTNIKEFLKKNVLSFGFILLLVVGLIAAGKDLSTALILAVIGVAMYFFTIKNKAHFMAFSAIVIGIFILGGAFTMLEGFRVGRFETFIDVNSGKELTLAEITGSGYQSNQSLIGIGSGGLIGKGFTNSVIKYSLPETVSATDAIFAVFAEEFGFIGSVILVLTYLALVLRMLKIINYLDNLYSQLIVIGIVTWIGAQAFINISGNVALIPVAGVPLPLISYGGSSLLMVLTGIAIVCNISRYQKDEIVKATVEGKSVVKSSKRIPKKR